MNRYTWPLSNAFAPSALFPIPPQRQQRLMDTALLALLKEAQPPLSSRTLYEDADERFKEEARWQAVPEVSRRRQLFGQFLATVKKAERQQAEAAEAAYRVRECES